MNVFSVWVGIGATIGIWRVAHSAPQGQVEAWVNTALFVQLFALFGARLFYVGMNWTYFSAHLLEIPQFWLGGLAWSGAVCGGGLAFLYLAIQFRVSSRRLNGRRSLNGLPLGWLGDRLYPMLPPLAITTWLGSWQVGAGYGVSLPSGAWWAIPSPDESGYFSLHFSLQPLAALFLLAFFCLLELRVKPFRPAGRISGLAMFVFLLHLLVTSLLRADPAPYWNGMRLDAWYALFYLIFFVSLVGLNHLLPRIWRKSAYLHEQRSSFETH